MSGDLPDVAGLYRALAALPDRTPGQLDVYGRALDALAWKDGEAEERDEDEWCEEAIGYALGLLVGVKLTRPARKLIAEAFGVDLDEVAPPVPAVA